MDLEGDWTSYYHEIPELNQPVIQGDHIIFAHFRGGKEDSFGSEYLNAGLHVLNKKNGHREWMFKQGVAPVIVDDGTVFILKDNFTSYDEFLKTENRTTFSAIDINSGEMKWAIDGRFGDLFNSMIKIKDKILLPGDGYLSAINCQNGNILWKKAYMISLGYQMECDRDGNVVYCPIRNFHNNSLSLIDPDSGERIKEINFFEVGNLVVVKSKVIAQVEMDSSDKGSLVCIDSMKKEVLWTIKGVRWSNAIPKPVIDQGTCYVFSFDDLIAVNISTGKIRWKIKYGKNVKYNLSWLPLNIIDHQVYWPDLNTPYIYKLDPKTGRTIQRIDLTHPIHSAFAYEDGVIYYRSKNVLYAEKVKL